MPKDGEFDIKDVGKLVEDVNTAFVAYQKKNDERLAEMESKGAVDVVTKAEFEAITTAMNEAQESINAIQAAQKRKSRKITDDDGNEVDLDAKAMEWAGFTAMDTKAAKSDVDSFDADAMTEYKAAFNRLARRAFDHTRISAEDVKALSVGSDTNGGYYVHPDMSGATVRQVYETSPMRQYASVQTISTDALEGYYDNDEVGFGWVSELESRTETTSPTIGKWRIPVHELYAMPSASQRALDDMAMNVEEWLSNKIADKFARAENAAFVNGDGVDKPRGVLTYADGTDLTNSIEQVDTGVNGGFAADPDGFLKLIEVQGKLKAFYRNSANWFCNRTTAAGARMLQDGDGRSLWQPTMIAGSPETLLGRPMVTSFEDMPDYTTTGALAMAYGDMASAYQIVDRIGIRMLRDPFTSKPSVLFYATKRTGGDMINGEALKLVKFAA